MANLFKVDNKETLWRYMDLPKFLNLITDSSLFFARSDKFTDKLEGEMTEFSKMIMMEELRAANFPYQIRNLHSDNADEYIKNLKQKTYISCWHLNQYESYTMWEAYAQGDYGIAVKSTVGNIRNCYKIHDKSDIKHGKIQYIDHKKDSIPRSLPYFEFLKKSYVYKGEEEFRAIYMELGSPHIELDNEKRSEYGLIIPIDLTVILDEVYVKGSAKPWFEKTLRSLLDNQGLANVPIKKSTI